jgi:hypothetical protein
VGWIAAYYVVRKQHAANSDGTDRVGDERIPEMERVVDALRRRASAGSGEAYVWLAARAAMTGEEPADDSEEIRRAVLECLQRTDNAAAQADGLRAVSWFVPRVDLGLDSSCLQRVEALEADGRAGLKPLARAAKADLVMTVRRRERVGCWIFHTEAGRM